MRQVLLIVAASTLAAPAQAEPAAPLPPSTKWHMDYGKTECRLLRSFGEGKQRVILQFSQIDPDPGVSMTVVAARVPMTDDYRTASFSTTTTPAIEARARGNPKQGDFLASLEVRPTADVPAAIARDIAAGSPTRLGIGFVRHWAVSLDLGPMKAPLAAFDHCVDDLVRG